MLYLTTILCCAGFTRVYAKPLLFFGRAIKLNCGVNVRLLCTHCCAHELESFARIYADEWCYSQLVYVNFEQYILPTRVIKWSCNTYYNCGKLPSRGASHGRCLDVHADFGVARAGKSSRRERRAGTLQIQLARNNVSGKRSRRRVGPASVETGIRLHDEAGYHPPSDHVHASFAKQSTNVPR